MFGSESALLYCVTFMLVSFGQAGQLGTFWRTCDGVTVMDSRTLRTAMTRWLENWAGDRKVAGSVQSVDRVMNGVSLRKVPDS